MKLYTDAAVNGDPGQAGVGFVVLDTNRHDQLSLPLPGTWNNHAAEFEAVVQALTWLSKEDLSNTVLFLYTDTRHNSLCFLAVQAHRQYKTRYCCLPHNFRF